MADTFAELFGAVFPTPDQVEDGVVYGPTGADSTGEMTGGPGTVTNITTSTTVIEAG